MHTELLTDCRDLERRYGVLAERVALTQATNAQLLNRVREQDQAVGLLLDRCRMMRDELAERDRHAGRAGRLLAATLRAVAGQLGALGERPAALPEFCAATAAELSRLAEGFDVMYADTGSLLGHPTG
jgi:hypothetical protein